MNSANSEISGSFGILTTALSLSNRTRSVISTVSSSNTVQPFASTFTPAGVSGHISLLSTTPSLSESLIAQPVASTLVPAGVLGHWSTLFRTPSLSSSMLQPFASTRTPAGVIGHWSLLSTTPSLSLSLGAAGVPLPNGIAIPTLTL